ncbi:MAG TPA: tetratricopeptide repeat protein [Candidatus Acidoferrales bacterium]|nr:tetratricopeptide repeat protein [Candidatus Acidoferrales bacterium]
MTATNTPSRRQKLEEFITAHPGDAFARYGLAMECAREGDHDAALGHFRRLLGDHPDYLPAYLQYGQFLARLARNDEARGIFSAGVLIARRRGASHAADEMQAALDALR